MTAYDDHPLLELASRLYVDRRRLGSVDVRVPTLRRLVNAEIRSHVSRVPNVVGEGDIPVMVQDVLFVSVRLSITVETSSPSRDEVGEVDRIVRTLFEGAEHVDTFSYAVESSDGRIKIDRDYKLPPEALPWRSP